MKSMERPKHSKKNQFTFKYGIEDVINPQDLRECAIRPVLNRMGLYSRAAENLLVMIAAHESKMGYYLKQTHGPALGIYQMEPDTVDDINNNFLSKRKELQEAVNDFNSPAPDVDDLKSNLLYQTAMARVFFLRFKEPIPAADDLVGLAKYAKKYWNTDYGAATVEDYLNAYRDLPK
ncbi:hypothetical protein [Aeromonas veronii]|uniref:hypothetical protein n=1 Tax=Aeromonas veronii TaxID=654 RepID=UPI003B9F198A